MVMNQEVLEKLGNGLKVKYTVLDNITPGRYKYTALIEIQNGADVELTNEKWCIYFCHIRKIEPELSIVEDKVEIEDSGVFITHINGCLFKMEPTNYFERLKPNKTLEIKITAEFYSVAKYDHMPNWFIVSEGLQPCLIQSTVGEDLNYVQDFTKSCQWKRFDYDLDGEKRRFDFYDPYTPDVRFDKHFVKDLGQVGHLVIPTPLHITRTDSAFISIKDWSIFSDPDFKAEAKYLADKSNLKISEQNSGSGLKNTIFLKHNKNLKINNIIDVNNTEAYTLEVKKEEQSIVLEARDKTGLFYAIQSFLSLLNQSETIPFVYIEDSPRYSYRGMHLDVSRNFHSKQTVLNLLDAMAMYKLNKFHFHLTDDEGWRLEIPGLPELVEVGSKRGYMENGDGCLPPLLGSGPFLCGPGSGYYSVQEYQEILLYAAEQHIEVIPEIDIPGHSNAAITAMKARYTKLLIQDKQREAEEYLLTDLEQKSSSASVQYFDENSLNPALESTFTFIEKIVEELKAMHKDINPLKTFHFGGDEVPYKAWNASPACQALVTSGIVNSISDLMEYFVRRVAVIVSKHDLCLGAWQDGIMDDYEPCPRSRFPNKEVYVYAWKNVWEKEHAADSMKLANKGYKIIMSQGTHLYFDHPYEPDPDERGLYWSCRFLDSKKVFRFIPENLFANADVKITGEVISSKERMNIAEKGCLEKLENQDNIIGIQGQLWTELVRTSDQLGEMIFPRLICLAERAWHKAPWEDIEDDERRSEDLDKDWELFANTLGYKELSRVSKCGLTYYLPPPGARWLSKLEFEAICGYPGLVIQYQISDTSDWKLYTKPVRVEVFTHIKLKTLSCDGNRHSRVVVLKCEAENHV